MARDGEDAVAAAAMLVEVGGRSGAVLLAFLHHVEDLRR